MWHWSVCLCIVSLVPFPSNDERGPAISEGGDIAAQVKKHSTDVNALVALTKHGNVYVRECAVSRLGESKDPKALDVLVQLASQWPAPNLKQNYKSLGNALVHQRYRPSVKELSSFLEGENLALAWFATKAVSAFEVRSLQPKLIDLVQRCPDGDTVGSAISSFGHLGPVASKFERVLQLAKDQDNPRHYAWVNLLAVYRANDRAYEFMVGLLKSADRRTHAVAVRYLSAEGIRSVALLAKVGSLIDHDSGELRCAVVGALEKATGVSFGALAWPCSRSPKDDEIARSWKEWLRRNKERLEYNHGTGRFTVTHE